MTKGEIAMPGRRQISACRDELKGLAIFWIVFYHARLGLTGVLGGFQSLGYAGVDIFFFLTGFGLYHSLETSGELRGYCRRRLRRILPAYLPLCVLWLGLMLWRLPLSTVPMAQAIAGNLLMIGAWANAPYMISWYMSGLLMALVLAPFAHACLSGAARPGLAAIGLLGAALLGGLCFAFDERLIMVARLPVFVLGMVFAMPGKTAAGAQGMTRKGATACVCLYALSFLLGACLLAFCAIRLPAALLDYGMYWYPFALMAPPLCAGLGWLLEKAQGARRFFAPLRWLGRASFEIFLLDCGMEAYFKKALALDVSPLWLWGSLLCVALGCLYHKLENELLQRFTRKNT